MIIPRIEGSAAIKKARNPRAKEIKPRTRKPKNVKESWVSHGGYDSRGRSLYFRPSDGRLVYLECCFPDCGKTNFKTIRSMMLHVSGMRNHHVGKGFFKNHAHVIELCGKLPSERQALTGGEEEHRLIDPYPHQEQIAYGSEPSILVSSLRQSATTYTIEQDSDGLNSREATSTTSPNISGDTSVTSMTPIMATHDVTIKEEVIKDVGGDPHNSRMAQGKGTIAQDCLSANEIKKIALPEYVSSMSYDTDDDDIDTAIHDAIQHQATARQRYLPELASLDAGQMRSLVDTRPEVHIKREDESIEAELFDQPVTANVGAAEIQETHGRIADITEVGGKAEVETKLADASVPVENEILVGGSDVDAGLFDQPLAANVAADIQETDGRIGDITERVGKPEIETELADASIPFDNQTLVGGIDINAGLLDQPLTANVAAATVIQETDGRIGDTTDLGDTVADSHQPSEEKLVAQTSSTSRARTTDPELCKGVSHKRASSITLALFDTTAQKRWRYDSYTFGPSSC